MPINTSWRVEIGTVASPTTFTSRVAGFNIQQGCDVNVIGRGSCRITLYNKDGALTPGGGGTYSSYDWFAQGLFISALTDTGGAQTVTPVFHGIITDFDLNDNGTFSTVTLTALDPLTVGGRTPNVNGGGSGSIDYTTLLTYWFTNIISGVSINYPRLGGTATQAVQNELRATPPFSSDQPEQCNTPVGSAQMSTAADLWQTVLIPTANETMWATTITTSGTTTTYNYNTISFSNTRSTANRQEILFGNVPLGANTLPFLADSFKQAFNNADLVTNSVFDALDPGIAETSVSASTVNTYGNRTQAFTQTCAISQLMVNRNAQLMANRYSTTRFGPVSLAVTASQVRALCNDAALARWQILLGISTGIWQPALITWRGSGSSSQQAECVIKGRTIDVSPADTTVTLELGNWHDNHSFILDTDQLDIDRLN